MNIAIVGTSQDLTEHEHQIIGKQVEVILEDYDPLLTTVITGGAKGVDKIASGVALIKGFAVKEILPLGIGWKYNKPRNIEIAKTCDKLICISTPVKTQKCYHHIELQNHEKTAGCWTLREAKKKGKDTELIILPAN